MDSTTENAQQNKRAPHLTLYIAGLFASAAIAGGGVYLWQHQTTQQTAPASQSSTPKPSTFVYAPKTGGLSLTLPTKYEVIVNVDGNKGGAAGATFKVATVTSDNVANDNVYGWVQVDIDNVDNTLAQEANIIKQQLQKDMFDNVKSVDATVDGQPAVLITGNGHAYAGNRQVYVVRSGDFVYTFTATGNQNDILDAVLKGVKIQAKNFR